MIRYASWFVNSIYKYESPRLFLIMLPADIRWGGDTIHYCSVVYFSWFKPSLNIRSVMLDRVIVTWCFFVIITASFDNYFYRNCKIHSFSSVDTATTLRMNSHCLLKNHDIGNVSPRIHPEVVDGCGISVIYSRLILGASCHWKGLSSLSAVWLAFLNTIILFLYFRFFFFVILFKGEFFLCSRLICVYAAASQQSCTRAEMLGDSCCHLWFVSSTVKNPQQPSLPAIV